MHLVLGTTIGREPRAQKVLAPPRNRSFPMSEITLGNSTRSNLLALQSTQSLLSRTSNRLSTGLKVSKPIDDAAAFFAAQALTTSANNNIKAQSAITEASNTIEAAISGLRSITKLVESIQGTLSGLSNATSLAQSNALLSQYNRLLTQIDNLANATSYQGVNLINTSTTTLDVSFSGQPGVSDLTITAIRSDSAGLSFSTIAAGLFFQVVTTISSQESRASLASVASVASSESRAALNASPALLQSGALGSSASIASSGSQASIPSNATNAASAPSQASTASFESVPSQESRSAIAAVNASPSAPTVQSRASIASIGSSNSIQSAAGAVVAGVNVSLITAINTQVGSALSTLTAAQATLGSTNAILAIRLEFSKSYVSTLQSGAASLTVAELNEESANLTSLQTAQSLGVVSLSISNQARQSLLRLF
jgi:flagellin